MFRALYDALEGAPERWSRTSLRFAFTAGSAIPVELIHDFERRGLLLKQGFGQTETSILCCLDERDAIRKAGSVGRPVFHAEVRVVDPEGLEAPPETWRDVAPGVTGEIVAFEVADHRVAVARIGDAVHAIDDTCTHAKVSLADGIVDADDCTIECPKHGALFDLTSGEPLTLPATRPVAVHGVEVRDGEVYVTLRRTDDG